MAKRKRKAKGKRRTKAKTEVQEEVKPTEAPELEEQVEEAPEEEVEEAPQEEPIKLFNTWSYTGITVNDPGLGRYMNLDPIIIPHTAGRMANRPFGKSRVNIVERLVNKCMRSGAGKRKIGGKYIRNKYACGKKEKVISEVKTAFDIVEKRGNIRATR